MITKETLNDVIYIGSDETGKGEWLGPLTVAAIALSDEQRSVLVTQGVMDSKELKIHEIVALSKIIRTSCLSYKVITVSPLSFNRLMKQVKQEGRNLNDILAWAHAQAVYAVLNELEIKKIEGRIIIFIDQFDKVKTEERLKRVIDLRKYNLEQHPRAESETSVAAASIMARSVRELWIDDKASQLKLDLRKLTPSQAKEHTEVEFFAKTSFLK